ncbi:MAG: carbamoyl-phosphate synthase domain-containing protein, partial [Pseudomonadota bacterium]
MVKPAILALADGTVFRGLSCGADGEAIGEVVFNTAMTGYQEILTDPSYCQQIVTLTYPHIGNTGTNSDDFESSKVHATGLVIRDRSIVTSSWRSEANLADFLRRANVVAISDLDTRALTRHIREHGAQQGCIVTAEDGAAASALAKAAVEKAKAAPGLAGADLAQVVTTDNSYQWAQGESWNNPEPVVTRRIAPLHVVAYDFGIKRNFLRLLVEHDCRVTVVLAKT